MKGGGTEPPSMSGRPSEAKGKLRLGWASSMKLAASRGAVVAQMPVWWVPALLGAHLTALSYFPPTRALLVNLLPCSLFVYPRDYKLCGAGTTFVSFVL